MTAQQLLQLIFHLVLIDKYPNKRLFHSLYWLVFSAYIINVPLTAFRQILAEGHGKAR